MTFELTYVGLIILTWFSCKIILSLYAFHWCIGSATNICFPINTGDASSIWIATLSLYQIIISHTLWPKLIASRQLRPILPDDGARGSVRNVIIF